MKIIALLFVIFALVSCAPPNQRNQPTQILGPSDGMKTKLEAIITTELKESRLTALISSEAHMETIQKQSYTSATLKQIIPEVFFASIQYPSNKGTETIILQDGLVYYTKENGDMTIITPSIKDWVTFRQNIQTSGVCYWRPEYSTQSTKTDKSWSLTLIYPACEVNVYNTDNFPGSTEAFKQYTAAIEDLLKGQGLSQINPADHMLN